MSVNDPPRLMVALVSGGSAAHARRGDLVELDVEQLQQLAGFASGRSSREVA